MEKLKSLFCNLSLVICLSFIFYYSLSDVEIIEGKQKPAMSRYCVDYCMKSYLSLNAKSSLDGEGIFNDVKKYCSEFFKDISCCHHSNKKYMECTDEKIIGE